MRITPLFMSLAACLIVALAASACMPVRPMPADATAPAPTAAADEVGAAATAGGVDTARWDELLQKWIEDPEHIHCDAPGGVLLVDTPAGRYLKAAGVASKRDGRPMQTDDRMEIGSSTKSFTSVLALQLQEEGVLSLDDPLSKWLPDVAAQLPYGDQITLRQLANHTAGTWDYEKSLLSAAVEQQDWATLAQTYTPEDLVQYVIAHGTPDFAPGTDWKYSNTNYILLGMAIEAAAGKPLAELYQERIFDPLGMANTIYLLGSPKPGEVVAGYTTLSSGEQVEMTNWNASQGGAAGAIASTAEDMATYIEALINGKLFQNPESLTEMLDFKPLNLEKGMLFMTGYGLGLLRYYTPGYIAIGHAGQTPGYQTVWFVAPEAQTVIVFNTNSGSCGAELLPMTLKPEAFGLTSSASGYPRAEPQYTGKRPLDLSAFTAALAAFDPQRRAELDTQLLDAPLSGIESLLQGGQLTSVDLVTYYVDRIQRYDVDKLNSVMELNPTALEEAQALDAERAAGKVRGPLHGIPVLLKDNIAAAGGMHNTAGAWALRDWQPDRDAFLVQKLRDAGALILGKTNLSEWANYMDAKSPAGFSVVGGQTRNPYGPYDTYGSSSGSAVAAAANFAAATVGTETQGSLIMPAGINSVVAIKPSLGLVSRDSVIPLLDWQDTPGPMGRTVSDAALLLTAMTGVDANDPATQDAAPLAGVDFTQFLSPEAAAGLRVGIAINTDEDIAQFLKELGIDEATGGDIRASLEAGNDEQRRLGQVFAGLGFEVVEVSTGAVPAAPDLNEVLPYGFRTALDAFLASLDGQVDVKSLADIIARNAEDLPNRAPYGQGYLVDAQAADMTEEEYRALKEQHQADARAGIQAAFADYDLDVLVTSSQAYAPAGFPAITVPNGYDGSGQPQGLVLVGDYLGEPKLIAAANAYEQATHARVAPDLQTTLQQIEHLGK